MHLDRENQGSAFGKAKIWLVVFLASSGLYLSINRLVLPPSHVMARLAIISLVCLLLFWALWRKFENRRLLRRRISQSNIDKYSSYERVREFSFEGAIEPRIRRVNYSLPILAAVLLFAIILLFVNRWGQDTAKLIAAAALMTSMVSLAGLVLTTIIALRKEPRESQQAKFLAFHMAILEEQSILDSKKKELEIEKLQRELASKESAHALLTPEASGADPSAGNTSQKKRPKTRSERRSSKSKGN